jgi:hypothetical protein
LTRHVIRTTITGSDRKTRADSYKKHALAIAASASRSSGSPVTIGNLVLNSVTSTAASSPNLNHNSRDIAWNNKCSVVGENLHVGNSIQIGQPRSIAGKRPTHKVSGTDALCAGLRVIPDLQGCHAASAHQRQGALKIGGIALNQAVGDQGAITIFEIP